MTAVGSSQQTLGFNRSETMIPFTPPTTNETSQVFVTSVNAGSGSEHNWTSADLWRENEAFARTVVPAIVYLVVVMVAGAIGNSLVVYVYSVRFRMTTQHFLIVCLACSDLVICLLAMPTEIADLRFHFNFSSEHACRLLRFVTMFCAIASNFVLVVIAVDRYRRICHPLRRQMSLREARWGAALSVLAALLSSWPLLVLTGLRTAETRVEGLYGQDCSFSDKFKDTKYPLAFNVTLGVGFILMTFTLAGLYFWIWRHARAHKRILRKLTVSSAGSPSVSSLSSTVSSFNSGSVGNSPTGATGHSSSVKTRKSSATNGHSQKKSVSQSDSLPSTNECTTGSDDITFVTLSVSESPVTNGNAKEPRSVSLSADVECSLENGANGANEGYISNGYCPKKNATSRSKSLSSSTEVPRIDGNGTPRSFRKGRNQHKDLHRVRSGSVSSTVSSVTASDIDSQGGQSPASVRKGRKRRSTTRSVDKTTIVAFSVTLVFVISFLPYLALMFVRAVIKDFDYTLHTPAQLNFYNIFIRFYLLNSAANPVIYGVLNEKFRKECWALCNRICCCLPKRLRNRR